MPRMVIFISAVSSELKSARQLVADTLQARGFETIWQDIPGEGPGDPREMLRAKIDECAGVIQLIGKCYGPEPPAPDREFGRVSYTQYEALYAFQRGKRLWCLFLGESFERDPFEPESEELARRQTAYADRWRDESPDSTTPADADALAATVGVIGNYIAIRLRQAASPPPAADTAQPMAGGMHPTAKPAPPAADAAPANARQVFDEDVQFTVYRPESVGRLRWETWLAFAHRGSGTPDEPDYATEVESQARAVLGAKFDDYATARQESGAALPRESTISIVPSVDGLEFNPAQRSFVWQEPVHREEFRGRALPTAEPGIRRGRITFYLGALVVAEINVKVIVALATPVGFPHDGGSPVRTEHARVYRQIFASYSRRDTAIVEHFEKLIASFGDRYLRDVRTLRAGEEWSPGLERMIRDADVFQLFWSSNSMRSRYVRQEWEYALSLARPHFVRPTYWENPIPKDPVANLPPDDLGRLHFQHLPIDLSGKTFAYEAPPRAVGPASAPAPERSRPEPPKSQPPLASSPSNRARGRPLGALLGWLSVLMVVMIGAGRMWKSHRAPSAASNAPAKLPIPDAPHQKVDASPSKPDLEQRIAEEKARKEEEDRRQREMEVQPVGLPPRVEAVYTIQAELQEIADRSPSRIPRSPADTEERLRALLAKYEPVLGADAPEISRVRYQLARTLEEEKKFAEALDVAKRAEAGLRKSLGAFSRETNDASTLRARLEAEARSG